MPDTLRTVLPYFTGVLFLLALLLFLISVHLFRRSRTDVFWRKRREAGQRGWRLFVFAFVLILLSGAACAATLLTGGLTDTDDTTPSPSGPTLAETLTAQEASPQPQQPAETPVQPDRSPAMDETPAAVASPDAPQSTPVIAPDQTLTPEVIIVSSTPVLTPTQTPYPTFTPNAAPLTTTVTPDPNAQITITALDDQISDQYQPVNPRGTFATGTTRIYLFVEFQSMTDGVLWRLNLYHNGELVEASSYLWGRETDGEDYFFIGNATGFEPGVYEIRLYIGDNDTPTSAMRFNVEEKAATAQ